MAPAARFEDLAPRSPSECVDRGGWHAAPVIYAFQGNNSMFFFATEGPDAGRAIHFASGPIDCELTGPFWTPDGTTLFLSVQHPGEETESLDAPTSHWPRQDGRSVPRPGVVAITGFPGWDSRRSFHEW